MQDNMQNNMQDNMQNNMQEDSATHTYTLHKKLQEVVQLYPQQTFVRSRHGDDVVELSYQDFYCSAVKIANFLLSLNVQSDDKVAIILENRIEWGAIYFGILLSGAIAVPMDSQAKLSDLVFFCEDAGCKVAFTSQSLAEKVGQISIAFPALKNVVTLEMLANSDIKGSPFPPRRADDVASILYTSGTTGKYKGVMLTHRNFLANYESITKLKFPIRNHHFLALLPLHHTFPFMATLLLPLFTQGKVTYLDSLKSDELLRCLQEDEITLLVGVPQLFYTLQKSIATKLKAIPRFIKWPLFLLREIAWWLRKTVGVNLSKLIFAPIHRTFGVKLRFLLSGGAKLDDATALFFLKLGFDLLEGYGLTETAPVVAFNCDKVHKLNSAGKAIPDVTVAIVSQENSEATIAFSPLRTGQVGEIVIRGPNVMLGYYKHKVATQEVLKDGWFYSGDLGYLDKDGYLYITGRSKEIIVLSSGKNIAPEEVERHYGGSHFIKEIGVMLGGTQRAGKLMAVVVPDFEYCQRLGRVNVYESIKDELEIFSRQLPSYKRIMGFIITKESLPRTRLGKLRRFMLQEQYAKKLDGVAAAVAEMGSMQGQLRTREQCFSSNAAASLSASDLALLAHPLVQQVISMLNIFVSQKDDSSDSQEGINSIAPQIRLNDHLEIDLGIESLARVELMMIIEKALHIKISTDAAAKVATVRELLLMLEELVAQQRQQQAIHVAHVANMTELFKQDATAWHDILQRDLPPEIKDKILLNFTKLQKFIFAFSDNMLKFIARLSWRLEVRGAENLPHDQAFILCPNHTSFLDGPIIAAALPQQLHAITFFIGLKEIFAAPFLRQAMRVMRVIPIDPGSELVAAMQSCAYVLRYSKAVCIFPEGGRSSDGEIKEFKRGVGILAVELNVPLVPVYISGSYTVWPMAARWPKLGGKITVTFGKAYTAAELLKAVGAGMNTSIDSSSGDVKYTAIACGLRKKVKELAGAQLIN